MKWRSDSGLPGNVVVVTGAAGGVGQELSRALIDAGVTVVGVDRPDSGVNAFVTGLGDSTSCGLEIDLADVSAHSVIVEEAQKRGSVVGLAHVAAVILRNEDFFSISEQEWDKQSEVNLKATFFLNRTFAEYFIRRGIPGSIVNYSSQGWLTGGFGTSIPYSATKGGVVSLTRGLARTLAAHRIRVNSIAAGGIDTAMMREGLSEEARVAFISQIPLGRLAEPSELVGPTIFLLSDASSYVTGAVLNVSGGQLSY